MTGGPNGPLAAETTGDTMQGPLTLANQANAPATPTGAAVVYATGGVMTYVNPQGLVNTIVGSQGGLTAAGSAITGTVAETVLQSMSLPANDAIPSAVYKLVGWGVFSTTASPGNTVFTMRLGGVAGTSLVASANIALTASLTNAQFNYEARINFLTPTSITADVEMTINTAAGGAANEYLFATTAPVTVSLTSTKAWVLDITPGASGNSITLLGGWSERVA
ncbi:hypothetical protein ABT186_02120 [Streptomyces sp. NPDC001634]|uniref:hypothetical protein n=1 Tax=Streptomyces sp. NPDC001634 TaxID=3154390 RepID=UPI0033319B67